MRKLAIAFMLLSGLFGGLAVTGCSVPAIPQDRYYRVDVVPPAGGAPVLSGTLEMNRFGAEGLSAGRAIIFVKQDTPLALQEYNYDFWHKPPAVMLRDALLEYLRGANVAKAIVIPEMRADADFFLNGRIHRMETQRGPSPKAVVELELGLSNARTGAVILVRSYRTDVPAENASVDAAVLAANKAVADIFKRFLLDLRGG